MSFNKSTLPGVSHAKDALRDHLDVALEPGLEPGSQAFVEAIETQASLNANAPAAEDAHEEHASSADSADSHSQTSSENSHASWDHSAEPQNADAENHVTDHATGHDTGLDAGSVASIASSHEMHGLDLAHALMESIQPAGSPALGMPANAGHEGSDHAGEHTQAGFELPAAAQNILASLTEHALTLPELPSLPQAALDAPSAAMPEAALSFVPVDLIASHYNATLDHVHSTLVA